MLRQLEAVKLSYELSLYTPAEWQPGEDIIIPPPRTVEGARALLEDSSEPDWYYKICADPRRTEKEAITMSETRRQETAPLLRLLGHPVRLHIALQLHQQPQTVSALEMQLNIRQPNLSQHLAVLRAAGLLWL